MKKIIRNSVLLTSKFDGQSIRTALFISSLVIFSLIAGAPLIGGGNGG
jgi:hypothetical protein